MKLNDLKPCPFCGGQPKFEIKSGFDYGCSGHVIECCYIKISEHDYGTISYKTIKRSLINKWNTRRET